MDTSDLITLADAMATYGHTRGWWFERRDSGQLQAFYIPGDRKLYFSRKGIEAYLTPKPWPRPGEADGAEGTA